MQTLVSQMDEFGVKPEDFIKESCELVLGYTPSSIMGFPTELAEALKILWNSSSIQECYRKRSRFHFNDSTKYYFEHLDRISSPEYIPSTVDILHSRVPTTGIVEYKFSIDDLHLRLLDVGGQRAERRKWIHCFTGITMIIFMASLNEYDQVLFEDSTQSRMRESIALFACIVNYEWFWETSFILF
ncbi:guanine nucleotide-binding protein G(q) subunit alpha-like, partial [Zophobas morio]|uniref:guanine nucleotide-binding protein G(q) subunit alpha-like n=1 Tax=Zophobas morio TaxID=2755281 RepID=UPI003082CF88